MLDYPNILINVRPFLGYFRLSEVHTYLLRKAILYRWLGSFWGVIQLPTTSGTRDINFLTYHWGVRPFFAFWEHFRLPEVHTYLKKVILYRCLWSFWGVIELPTNSGTRDIHFLTYQLDPFLLFWGTSGCRKCIHIFKRSYYIDVCDHFEGSYNFLRPVELIFWHIIGGFDPFLHFRGTSGCRKCIHILKRSYYIDDWDHFDGS